MRALIARVSEAECAEVRLGLSPAEFTLFAAMDVVDQRHALDVAKLCRAMAPEDVKLYKTALLHDCGKRRGDISLSGRIFAVIAQAVAPEWSSKAGLGSDLTVSSPWRRALALRFQHGEMGANRLDEVSVDAEIIWLVRNHHAETPDGAVAPERAARLRLLQQADDQA